MMMMTVEVGWEQNVSIDQVGSKVEACFRWDMVMLQMVLTFHSCPWVFVFDGKVLERLGKACKVRLHKR